jgi:hypothetical protein
MSANLIVVTGDQVALPIQLTINGAKAEISASAVAHAALVSIGHHELYTASILQSKDATGAAWSTGLFVVEFDPEDTAAVTFQGRALIEIQVDDGGPLTWFVPVQIVTGKIPANTP